MEPSGSEAEIVPVTAPVPALAALSVTPEITGALLATTAGGVTGGVTGFCATGFFAAAAGTWPVQTVAATGAATPDRPSSRRAAANTAHDMGESTSVPEPVCSSGESTERIPVAAAVRGAVIAGACAATATGAPETASATTDAAVRAAARDGVTVSAAAGCGSGRVSATIGVWTAARPAAAGRGTVGNLVAACGSGAGPALRRARRSVSDARGWAEGRTDLGDRTAESVRSAVGAASAGESATAGDGPSGDAWAAPAAMRPTPRATARAPTRPMTAEADVGHLPPGPGHAVRTV